MAWHWYCMVQHFLMIMLMREKLLINHFLQDFMTGGSLLGNIVVQPDKILMHLPLAAEIIHLRVSNILQLLVFGAFSAFTQKKNMLHITSSFWGESISNLCIPSQKVIHADRISMSWRHHEELVFIPKIASSPQEPIPIKWIKNCLNSKGSGLRYLIARDRGNDWDVNWCGKQLHHS